MGKPNLRQLIRSRQSLSKLFGFHDRLGQCPSFREQTLAVFKWFGIRELGSSQVVTFVLNGNQVEWMQHLFISWGGEAG